MDEVKIVYYYLKSSILKNPVMVDVGSHSGSAFITFAKAGWTVHGFEPNPLMRKKCLDNIARWNLNNVHLYDFALSDTNQGDIDFYISKESTGISSLIPFHSSHESKFKVPVLTFKKWESERPLEKVDFLKIDVEGNDIKVLKGFNWEKFSPQAVVVEYEDGKTQNIGIKMPDIFNFLKSKGYTVIVSEWYPIEKYGMEHSWKRFLLDENALNYDPKAWGNLIAFKEFNFELFVTATQNASIDEIKILKKNFEMLPPSVILRSFKLRFDSFFTRLKRKLGIANDERCP